MDLGKNTLDPFIFGSLLSTAGSSSFDTPTEHYLIPDIREPHLAHRSSYYACAFWFLAFYHSDTLVGTEEVFEEHHTQY
jgi:hypothetical protein